MIEQWARDRIPASRNDGLGYCIARRQMAGCVRMSVEPRQRADGEINRAAYFGRWLYVGHIVAQFDQRAAGFMHRERPRQQSAGIVAAGFGVRDHLAEEIVIHTLEAMTQTLKWRLRRQRNLPTQVLELTTTPPAAADCRRHHAKRDRGSRKANRLCNRVVHELHRIE